ncbi:hypothetical protein HWV62_25378 [Athelia sp. TMB]|nr:hypothetical protein HWV62_25378 [Athelia sp. TMB]
MSSELEEEFEAYRPHFSLVETHGRKKETSEREIQIDVEPDDLQEGLDPFKLTLSVHYPEGYPDILPELSLDAIDGELEDEEKKNLIEELKAVGEENLGIAMTFTIVSHLRERLSDLVKTRAEAIAAREREKERLAIEAEEARTRGTPVTVESFNAWKAKFDAELAAKKAKEEDERMKGLTPKEREEWKRAAVRLSGRQLFEKNRNLEEDTLLEEGTVSVDFSQYERTKAEEEEEEHRLDFSDSD